MKYKLNKKIFLILLVCFLFSLTFISAFSGAGTGTLIDPFQITNCTQLQEINNSLISNYSIINNINCSDTKNWNNGSGFIPIGFGHNETFYNNSGIFRGTLDGNYYSITDLFYNYKFGLPYYFHGIFSYTNESTTIKNINITNFNFTGNVINGALVAVNYGNIYNVYVNGTYSGSSRVTGLVSNNYGNIINCSSSGKIIGPGGQDAGLVSFNYGTINTSKSTTSVDNIFTDNQGGLVGTNYGTIFNSYSRGAVEGANWVGGLVGYHSSGYVYNSFATGLVTTHPTGPNNLGGGLTSIVSSGGYINSFWDIDTSNWITSGRPSCITPNCGIGKITSEMKTQSTYQNYSEYNFTSWDFTDIWQICSEVNDGYPSLRYIDEPCPTIRVTLNKPDNSSSSSISTTFNCSAISEKNAFTSATLQIYNKTSGELYYNETKSASGLLNTTLFDYNFTTTDTYLWNCEFTDNSSLSFSAPLNYTLYLNTVSPAITLEKPSNNNYINTIPTYLNFTATDPDGLSTCELWGNFTGSWAKNYTWNNPTSGVTTFTTLNLEDNLRYDWNVWCNDTVNNGIFSPNNFTFGLDTIYPTTSIDNITTISGSQVVTFYSTSIDNNNGTTCKFSVYNLAGGIEGINNNLSFTCNQSYAFAVSGFATYILQVYTTDIGGNVNWTNKSFVTFTTTPPSGGGGGSGTVVVTSGNWTMETEFGGSSYQFAMIQKTSRTKDLVFENLGTTSRTIKLTCEPVSGSKNLCDNIEFENAQFSLPLQRNIKTSIPFRLAIPSGYEKGRYVVNLIGTDEVGNKGIITLTADVTSYSSITGAVTKLFSNTESNIPYFLIFALISFMSGVLINFTLFKPNKIPAALSVVAGLFIGVVFLLLPI